MNFINRKILHLPKQTNKKFKCSFHRKWQCFPVLHFVILETSLTWKKPSPYIYGKEALACRKQLPKSDQSTTAPSLPFQFPLAFVVTHEEIGRDWPVLLLGLSLFRGLRWAPAYKGHFWSAGHCQAAAFAKAKLRSTELRKVHLKCTGPLLLCTFMLNIVKSKTLHWCEWPYTVGMAAESQNNPLCWQACESPSFFFLCIYSSELLLERQWFQKVYTVSPFSQHSTPLANHAAWLVSEHHLQRRDTTQTQKAAEHFFLPWFQAHISGCLETVQHEKWNEAAYRWVSTTWDFGARGCMLLFAMWCLESHQ